MEGLAPSNDMCDMSKCQEIGQFLEPSSVKEPESTITGGIQNGTSLNWVCPETDVCLPSDVHKIKSPDTDNIDNEYLGSLKQSGGSNYSGVKEWILKILVIAWSLKQPWGGF